MKWLLVSKMCLTEHIFWMKHTKSPEKTNFLISTMPLQGSLSFLCQVLVEQLSVMSWIKKLIFSTHILWKGPFLHVPSATWLQIYSLLQAEPPCISFHLLCVSPLPASATSPSRGSPGPLSLGNVQCFPLLRDIHGVMTYFFCFLPPKDIICSNCSELKMSSLTPHNSLHVGIEEFQGGGLLDLKAKCSSSLQGLRNLTSSAEARKPSLPDSAAMGFPFILSAR